MPPNEPAPEVRLRDARADDHPTLLEWRRDPDTHRQLMFRARVETLDEVAAWVARRSEDPDGAFRLIARPADDHPIGFIQLTGIDHSNRRATLGLFVEASVRGAGTAATALQSMESLASKAFGLHKIVIEVLASNARALRFWRRQGYRPVGTLRDHYSIDDALHDVELLEKVIQP